MAKNNKLQMKTPEETATNMQADIPEDTTSFPTLVENEENNLTEKYEETFNEKDNSSDIPENDNDDVEFTDKEEYVYAVQIKLKKRHPQNAFRVGSIVINSYDFKEYELTQEELEELQTEGPQAWLDFEL